MKQEIKQALLGATSGIEDRSGINSVTILSSKLRSGAPPIDMDLFVSSLIELLDELDLPNDALWYQIYLVTKAFGRQNQALASKLSEKLQDDSSFAANKGRYDALKAFAVANGGLTPMDISEQENKMKSSAPGLWLDLVLLAHSNDDEALLTNKIIELISGTNPQLGWERLRSKTTEIRKAFPDLRAFRKAIRKIAREIEDQADRLSFLKAMDERLGTNYANDNALTAPKRSMSVGGFGGKWLNPKTINSEKKFARTKAEPRTTELALA